MSCQGMTHIPKTASEALSTLDALMETHVLVLKEPTSGMLDDGYAMDCVPVGKLERAYKAMIAAAQEKNNVRRKMEIANRTPDQQQRDG